MAQFVDMASGSFVASTRGPGRISGAGLVRRTAQCLILVWLLVAALSAQAFGPRGHELVAQLATWYLNSDAEALLQRHYGENYRPGFLDASQYPAEILARPGNEWRLGFHYTWFQPDDTGFVAAGHCPQGVCSVAAVRAARDLLMQPGITKAREHDALRFLVHYVADLHDPVNAGFRRSKGGRALVVYDSNLEPHSLYAIWQDGLFDALPGSPFVMANAWARQITDEQRRAWQTGEPQAWVWASHEVARDLAWPLIERAGGWNAAYRQEALPVLTTQLQKAAVRLAWILNQVVSTAAQPRPQLDILASRLLDYPEAPAAP